MARPWRASLARPVLLLLAAANAAAQPAPIDEAWLDGAAAREFRLRVAQLALIYGDSRGIDLRGLLVTARRIGDVQGDCSDIGIAVLDGERELRREQLRVCRHAGSSVP